MKSVIHKQTLMSRYMKSEHFLVSNATHQAAAFLRTDSTSHAIKEQQYRQDHENAPGKTAPNESEATIHSAANAGFSNIHKRRTKKVKRQANNVPRVRAEGRAHMATNTVFSAFWRVPTSQHPRMTTSPCRTSAQFSIQKEMISFSACQD